MNKKKQSFSGQLKRAFVLVIMIPVLFLGGFIFHSSYRYIKEQKTTESKNVIKQNRVDLENRIDQCETSLRYLAVNYSLQEFIQMDREEYIEINRASKSIGALVYNVLLSNQYYKDISIYIEDEFHVLSDIFIASEEVSEESWYQNILGTSAIYWWCEDDDIFIGKKIVTDYPVKALGVVVIELQQDVLADSFEVFGDLPVKIEIYDDDNVLISYNNLFKTSGFETDAELADTGWHILYQVDKGYYTQNVLTSFGIPMLIIFLVLFIVWLCIHVMSQLLVKDLAVLVKEVDEVKRGDFDIVFQESNTKEIDVLSESIQSMVDKIKQLIRQVYTKEIERQSLELDLLQAKINPHFLYNNLSAINWLALDCGEEKISEITTEMATFYRTALNKGNNIDYLSVEVTNIKAYVNLQLIAHENSFDIVYDIPDMLLTCVIPIFILQPLVENAIEHGISREKSRRGKIIISAEQEEAYLYLKVYDNGMGLYEQIGNSVMAIDNFGYGTSNVHKRIQLLYGGECGLSISADESGTTSSVKLIKEYLKK